ncbi:MAG TPA: hypothetical protein VHZ52_16045 [Acidobacteriaceae bacterium]|jgi:hypothetical protein|nr:hypothetical protein [Acidobacteriaceae bacterium]
MLRHGPLCIALPLRSLLTLRLAMFNFGTPATPGQWIVRFLLAVVALSLVWWLLRVYIH